MKKKIFLLKLIKDKTELSFETKGSEKNINYELNSNSNFKISEEESENSASIDEYACKPSVSDLINQLSLTVMKM